MVQFSKYQGSNKLLLLLVSYFLYHIYFTVPNRGRDLFLGRQLNVCLIKKCIVLLERVANLLSRAHELLVMPSYRGTLTEEHGEVGREGNLERGGHGHLRDQVGRICVVGGG